MILMTGNTSNPIEQLVQQIHKGHHATNRVPVRKIYIDEDPTKEQTEPCPRCLDRNQQHMMRYLFLNMNEAIYKCEAADCMYPFRNFKFKNFDECTVYRYQSQSQDAFDAPFANNFSSECYSYENPLDNVTAVDFSLDFLASDSAGEQQPQRTRIAEPVPQNIAPTASDYGNLSSNFDTGFIDDILQDLFPSTSISLPKTSNDMNSKIVVSIQAASANPENVTLELSRSTVGVSTQTGGRKLEKCLRVFEKPSKTNEDSIFKVPKVPEPNSLVVEHISPTKLRIKKIDSPTKSKKHKGSKNKKRKTAELPMVAPPSPYGDGGRMELNQASALMKNKKIKPLEFVSTLNTLIQQKKVELPAAETRPTIRKTPNCAKVQKMLNFIQRSMKTGEGKECPENKSPSESEESSRESDTKLETSYPWNDSLVSSHTENYFAINGSMQPIDNEVDQA